MLENIKNKKELCDYLGISEKRLNYILYVMKNSGKGYIEFEIPKKSGGTRVIKSPCKELKKLQKKILLELELIFKPSKACFGFVKNKSIVSNAEKHLRKKYIVNIDIENFFPTINFGRVLNLLISLGINKAVAIILTQLVTYENQLPQGASTSPILSNMICKRLDREFENFSKKYDISYTRYADDITFSCNQIDALEKIYSRDNKKITEMIYGIINSNGFQVNEKKIRFSPYYRHQEVTGIIVNDKKNVNKNFFYRARSMVNALEKFGLEKSYEYFCKKRNMMFDINASSNYEKILLGMLNYLKMVRGEEDFRYKKLAKRFNIYKKNQILKIKYNLDELKKEAVFLLTCLSDETRVGTAFAVDKYIITCYHCILENDFHFIHNETIGKISIALVETMKEKDLAIFKNPFHYRLATFQFSDIATSSNRKVIALGYPDFISLDTISHLNGYIVNQRSLPVYEGGPMNTYWVSDLPIQPGLSGGPIIDSNDSSLIGIVEFGAKKRETAEVDNAIRDKKDIEDALKSLAK